MTESKIVIEQLDYIQTMKLIEYMLAKTSNKIGSVILGKEYALYYKTEISKLLESEYINIEILNELKLKVVIDLETIRNDCKRRFSYTDDNNVCNVADNNYMMSMISDFILTLK